MLHFGDVVASLILGEDVTNSYSYSTVRDQVDGV